MERPKRKARSFGIERKEGYINLLDGFNEGCSQTIKVPIEKALAFLNYSLYIWTISIYSFKFLFDRKLKTNFDSEFGANFK